VPSVRGSKRFISKSNNNTNRMRAALAWKGPNLLAWPKRNG